MYLAWFDPDRKKPVQQKIADARERYREKFGQEPAICLVNAADTIDNSAIELRPVAYVGRHYFLVGHDDVAEQDVELRDTPVSIEPVPATRGASSVEAPDDAITASPARHARRARPASAATPETGAERGAPVPIRRKPANRTVKASCPAEQRAVEKNATRRNRAETAPREEGPAASRPVKQARVADAKPRKQRAPRTTAPAVTPTTARRRSKATPAANVEEAAAATQPVAAKRPARRETAPREAKAVPATATRPAARRRQEAEGAERAAPQARRQRKPKEGDTKPLQLALQPASENAAAEEQPGAKRRARRMRHAA